MDDDSDDDSGSISDTGGLIMTDNDLMLEKDIRTVPQAPLATTTLMSLKLLTGTNNKAAALPTKKKKPHKNRKPPDAPKRFKSSFIFFSMAKHKEIKDRLSLEGESTKATNITKIVSDAWRNMDDQERAKYEEYARRDKERYNIERASYVAPPGHPSTSKRRRDPDAPRRPMSAYLAYANMRRAGVKAQNPDCSNGEISKILSSMWKDAPDEVKQRFKDDEHALWDTYKVGMVEWRKKNDGRKKQAKSEVGQGTTTRPSSSDFIKGGKGTKGRKGKANKPSLDDAFDSPDEHHHDGIGVFVDDHQLSLGRLSGFMDGTGNPNPEEMMAASALRGVRGGPVQHHHQQQQHHHHQQQQQQQQFMSSGQHNVGPGDFGNQFPPHNVVSAGGGGGGGGGYGAFLGMNGISGMQGTNGMNNMNSMSGMNSMNAANNMNALNNMNGMNSMNGMNNMNNMNSVPPMIGDGAHGNAGGFRQLDVVGYPYKQYGGYPLGGNQAMLLAQLRASDPYPHHTSFLSVDQQQNLSQLATLAGTQNATSMNMGQHSVGMNSMGMGGLVNDNSVGGSGGGMNRHGGGGGGGNNNHTVQLGMAPF